MTDGDALHKAICDDPDEDTPRLAYADWLQEQGGKDRLFRAEYIRGAVRVAREEHGSPAWAAAHAAWDKHDAKVRQQAAAGKLPWVTHLKGRVRAFEYDRGFVGHITVFSKRFVAEGDKFFAKDPIRSVRFISLTASSGTVPAKTLFASPHMARVLRLSLDGSSLEDAELRLMAASPNLKQVKTLSLAEYQRFTAKGLLKLLQELPAVTEFQMPRSNHFDDKFAAAFAGSPALGKLTSLDLTEHSLSPKGLTTLLTTKHGANLRELRASVGFETDSFYDDEDDEYDEDDHLHYEDDEDSAVDWRFQPADGAQIAAVLRKCRFPELRFLDCSGWRLGDDGLKALVAGGGFPSLRRIDLSANDLTRDGMKALADSPLGPQLVWIGTGFDEVLQTDKAMREVRKMFPNARVTGFGVA